MFFAPYEGRFIFWIFISHFFSTLPLSWIMIMIIWWLTCAHTQTRSWGGCPSGGSRARSAGARCSPGGSTGQTSTRPARTPPPAARRFGNQQSASRRKQSGRSSEVRPPPLNTARGSQFAQCQTGKLSQQEANKDIDSHWLRIYHFWQFGMSRKHKCRYPNCRCLMHSQCLWLDQDDPCVARSWPGRKHPPARQSL